MKVLITGGELFNKGAQSMTFTVVNEVLNRYPEAEIQLLSARDYTRDPEQKSRYRFAILPWDMRVKLRHVPLIGTLFKNKHFNAQQEAQLWNAVRQADVIIDVSGYCLSSQFSVRKVVDYLLNVYHFKRYRRTFVLMPQSFGPFDFGKVKSFFVNKAITHYLRYPALIHAREEDGLARLADIGVSENVQLSPDTVLQSAIPKVEHIYHQPVASQPEIRKGAVGIVPNQKIFQHNTGNSLEGVYQTLVEQVLASGRCVYLLRHSHEDLSICEKIKGMFADNDDVVVLGEDYDAYQLTAIIEHFDFLISSRYHGVVHAYKCNVPALILGWAVKYRELAARFDQTQYCFDVRNEFDAASLVDKLNTLMQNCSQESERIKVGMQKVKEENVFNRVFELVERQN